MIIIIDKSVYVFPSLEIRILWHATSPVIAIGTFLKSKHRWPNSPASGRWKPGKRKTWTKSTWTTMPLLIRRSVRRMEVSSDKVGSLFRWVLRMGTAKGACVLADMDIYEISSGKYFSFPSWIQNFWIIAACFQFLPLVEWFLRGKNTASGIAKYSIYFLYLHLITRKFCNRRTHFTPHSFSMNSSRRSGLSRVNTLRFGLKSWQALASKLIPSWLQETVLFSEYIVKCEVVYLYDLYCVSNIWSLSMMLIIIILL